MLGLTWSFLNPLLMLTVYTFVFSVVFKARWNLDELESRTNFAIILFVGLIVHGLFAECLNRAPSLILANVNYVKRVVFPLEILPCVVMGSALFHATISLIVLQTLQLVLNQTWPLTSIFLPLVLFPLLLGTLGLTWIIASIGVYIRDVGQVVNLTTMMLLFLSPVFYPSTALPQTYRWLLYLNPLTFVIEEVRDILVFGNAPHWLGLAAYTVCSLLVAWIGFMWFQKTRRGFADVI
jgi:lipopolysaccharide transport system permease protein